MEHRPSARAGAMVALAALVLSACGGSALPAVRPPATIPAARLLTQAEARSLPKVKPTPTPTASTLPGVIAPTAAPLDRPQGPPGNPTATSFSDPPAVGRYPHRVVVSGSFGRQQVDVEVDIKDHTPATGGRRQVQVWDIPDFPQEFQYLWTPNRLLLERVKSTDLDGSENECEMEPPVVQARLPMEVGETWSTDSTCGETTSKGTSEIIRTERVTVGGVEVDTFVIRSQSTTKGEQGSGKETSTAWYAPRERLFVLVQSESTGSFGTIEFTIEALSLSPSG